MTKDAVGAIMFQMGSTKEHYIMALLLVTLCVCSGACASYY